MEVRPDVCRMGLLVTAVYLGHGEKRTASLLQQSILLGRVNDASWHTVWLLTVPLLLLEFLLVVKLQADKLDQKAWTLGVAAALMTVSGYYGE